MDAIPTLAGPDRMPPIAPEAMTPAQAEAAAILLSGPRGELRGPFIPLLRSPGFMNRIQKVGEYIRYECGLPDNLRELAILVIARKWAQTTEWYLHVLIALKAGVSPRALVDLAAQRAPTGLTDDEAAIYDFCTELHDTHGVGDASYARVKAILGDEGLIQLTGLCGYYTTLAMIMNMARTPIPAGVEPFAVPA